MRSSLLSGEVPTDDPTIGAMLRSVTASTLEVAVDSARRSLDAVIAVAVPRYPEDERTTRRIQTTSGTRSRVCWRYSLKARLSCAT